jgi:hypothetical protein
METEDKLKIIGKGAHDNLIVEMDKTELLRLVGLDYESQLPTQRAGESPFSIGYKFDISLIYLRLRDMRQHKDTLRQAAHSLRYFADLIGPVEKLILESITAPTQEEEKG